MRKFVWALLMVVSVGLVVGGAVEAKAGSKIAYLCTLPGTGFVEQICTMNPDGSGAVAITNFSSGTFPGGFSWSPDGSRIAFGRGANQSFIIDSDGSNLVEVFPSIPLETDGFDPFWSPELPAQVSAISVGGTYALVFMMGVMAALMMVNRQDRRQGFRPEQDGRLIG